MKSCLAPGRPFNKAFARHRAQWDALPTRPALSYDDLTLQTIMRSTPFLALVALLTLGPRPTVEARQCVMFRETDELFRINDVVFTGTVLSNTPVPGPEDGVQNIGVLRADQFWKGTPVKEIRVGSDLPFKVGERYVVFAGGEPLSTTIACEATQPLDKATKKRLWLSRRPSRTAG